MLIGEVVVGVIEGVAATVQLLAESLGFAAGHLAERPKRGEHRFSRRRLLIAFLPLTLVVGGLAGLFFYVEHGGQRRVEQRNRTRALVEQHAERLVRDRGPDGRLVRGVEGPIATLDAWGRPLRVRYERAAFQDVVVVWSAGPDGEDQTWDDVKSRKTVFLAKEAGRAAVKRMGGVLKQRIKPEKDD